MEYTIKINYRTHIKAHSEEEAMDNFFNMLEENNQTAESFICDEMTIGNDNCALIGRRG